MKLIPPYRIDVGRGGTVRFRVAASDGRRSSTWVVKGHKFKRDVFVGTRDSMDEVKLSPHGLECWRIAWTSEAVARDPTLGKRELLSFDPPPEFAPGWRTALSILVPTTSRCGQSTNPPPWVVLGSQPGQPRRPDGRSGSTWP